MKNRSIFLVLTLSTFLLASCGDTKTQEAKTTDSSATACSAPYTINTGSGRSLDLKAKVISDNVRNVLSWNAGSIEFLDCEKGKKVTEKTLIAKIKPDFTDQATQNLVNQSAMITAQIGNSRDIIASTKANFDTQLNSLLTQKSSIEGQLKIANDSYAKIDEQKGYGIQDIDSQLASLELQLKTLDTQISDLSASRAKLEDSKKADLEKVRINLSNTKTQTKSLASNVLTQVDEVFWITPENRNKNDAYEMYLSSKAPEIKSDIDREWRVLHDQYGHFDDLTDATLPDFLQSLNTLAGKAKSALSNSVSTSSFPQSSIDSLYAAFTQYESGIITAKNTLDNAVKSLDTVSNSYDTQILSLNTQVNSAQNSKKSTQTNIDNLKSNKLGTYTTTVDIQKNQTKAQMETYKLNISNLSSQIDALKSQREIQLNQLNNQLSQLQSSLNTLNINLAGQSLFAEVTGTIKDKPVSLGNKIAASTMVCQILPDKSSLKIQVYASYDLPLPLGITMDIDGKTYSAKLTSKLPYQDATTQNFIYETSGALELDGKSVNISEVLSEGKTLDISTVADKGVSENTTLFVPINYVSNTIAGSRVRVQWADGIITEKSIVLWELDANNVEVRSGLTSGETICN